MRRRTPKSRSAIAALTLALVPAAVHAQINAGRQAREPTLPFTMKQVATFDLPWRIAFLPDGRMLITEKVGPVWLCQRENRGSEPGTGATDV